MGKKAGTCKQCCPNVTGLKSGARSGQLLFKAIAKLALGKGLKEFAWHVLEGNDRAEKFYEWLVGMKDPGWHRWTIKEQEIERILVSEGV